MKNLSLLIAFAGGAVAGAIIGVMLAPEKGSDLRKKMCDEAHNRGHEAKLKLKHFLDSHGIKLECCQLDDLVDELIENDSPAREDQY